MKKIIAIIAIALVATLAQASTAFLRGQRVSGMNKICYYHSIRGDVAITIGLVELCPLSIEAD